LLLRRQHQAGGDTSEHNGAFIFIVYIFIYFLSVIDVENDQSSARIGNVTRKREFILENLKFEKIEKKSTVCDGE
jgi:hypothetical protein